MTRPSDRVFAPSRWLWSALESSSKLGRRLPLAVYPLLALLAAMQVADARTLQRIASQSAGRALLSGVAVLLLLSAAAALARVVTHFRGGLEPDVRDAFLHFSLAIAGLGTTIGNIWLTTAQVMLLVGALGLALSGTGLHLLACSALGRARSGARARGAGFAALDGRDLGVRGGVLVVLGAFLYATAVTSTPGHDFALTSRPWGLGLLVAAALALLGYGLHTSWQLREEHRLEVSGP